MSDSWENITVGMKIEVANADTELTHDVYWIATVTNLAGIFLTVSLCFHSFVASADDTLPEENKK